MPCPECGSEHTCGVGINNVSFCCDCNAEWTTHYPKGEPERVVIKDTHGNDPRGYRCECGHPQHQHCMIEGGHPEGWFKEFECEWYNCDCTEFKMKDDRFEIIDGKIIRKE